MELDAIDRRILDRLQRNGRVSNVELAREVGLSPSPCLRRVRDLETAGIIDRYAAVLDQTAVGLSLSVFVQVTLERQIESALETFERVVGTRPEVMECYLMTGDSDYLLRVVVADVTAYERFL
ncbi:MAG: Lrp/AsnC family transcriptional regulator, partial [Rhodospirillaceae bacterium]